jgi:hypothetical protein
MFECQQKTTIRTLSSSTTVDYSTGYVEESPNDFINLSMRQHSAAKQCDVSLHHSSHTLTIQSRSLSSSSLSLSLSLSLSFCLANENQANRRRKQHSNILQEKQRIKF